MIEFFEKKSNKNNNYKISQRLNLFNRPNNKNFKYTTTGTPALVRLKEKLLTKSIINEYIECAPFENTCQNEGICYKTNPYFNTLFKKKFCRLIKKK